MCPENFPFFSPSLLMTTNLQDHFSFMHYELWILLFGKFSPVKKKGEKHQYASGGLDKTDLDPAYQIMLGSMIFLWQTFATWW